MKKMKEKSATKSVLEHLERCKSITSKEAFELYGATRLSSIIYNLKYDYGYEIETEMISVKTRYGTNTNVAKYVLVKEGE